MNYTVTLLLNRIFILLLIISRHFCVAKQHITVKYTLEDNNFHRVMFNKQLGV